MDSPLALQVWVSESPIAYPCWSVVSRLPPNYICRTRPQSSLKRRRGAWIGIGVLCRQGSEGLGRIREASRTDGDENRRLII